MEQDVKSLASLTNELMRENKFYEAIYILEKNRRNTESNDPVVLFKLAKCIGLGGG